MDLRTYLFNNRLSVKEFAEKLHCSRTHMSAVMNGRLKPSIRLAASIERETNGEVKIKELLGE